MDYIKNDSLMIELGIYNDEISWKERRIAK